MREVEFIEMGEISGVAKELRVDAVGEKNHLWELLMNEGSLELMKIIKTNAILQKCHNCFWKIIKKKKKSKISRNVLQNIAKFQILYINNRHW